MKDIINSFLRNIELIVVFILIIVLISVYSFTNFGDKIFFSSLGVLIMIYFGILKYKIENDKLFKELFHEFNFKYDEKFNDYLNQLKSSDELPGIKENLIIDYFNFCAEEYLWRSRNRIPKQVWTSWKAGIKENLKIPEVKKIYDKEIRSQNSKKSYYGLVEELEK